MVVHLALWPTDSAQLRMVHTLTKAMLLTVSHGLPCPMLCVPLAVTPPGFYTSGNTTQQCPAGSYRAGWQANATSCQSCGVGVLADKRDSFTVYTYVGNTTILVNVSTSSADCCK